MNAFLKRAFQVVVVCCWVLAASTADGQLGRPEGLYYKSWAVVVGIDNYLLAPKLSSAITEAKAVAEAFRELGFEEVLELYDKDASQRRLKSILTEYLPRKAGRQDRVVIFFAGHAGTGKDMRGKEIGHLVPWDAQVNNAAKSVTLDDLKDFSRRVMSKHTLFLLNAGVSGWDVTPPQQVSLAGRLSPEEETDKRVVQVLTAARKGEALIRKDGQGIFVQSLLSGLKGDADKDGNGWWLASELGDYVKQQVEASSGDAQHPQFARLAGDGDMVLIEGKKEAYFAKLEPTTEAERIAAAQKEYDKAFLLLQQQRPAQSAIDRLNRALAFNPKFGDAYILKSYLHLEFLPDLDEALAAAELAVKHAPENPDSSYTLGLILQRRGQFLEAEKALRQALSVNPDYTDVYLSLGDLYAEDLNDREKSVEAYRRYLQTGGTENKARDYLQKSGAGELSRVQ